MTGEERRVLRELIDYQRRLVERDAVRRDENQFAREQKKPLPWPELLSADDQRRYRHPHEIRRYHAQQRAATRSEVPA